MIVWPGLRRFISTVQRLFNSASFYAPLTHSLVLDRGTGAPTFTRATTATVTNNDGYLVTALAGEARFEGARRVRNLLSTTSENFSNVVWSKTGSTSVTGTNVLNFPVAVEGVTQVLSPIPASGSKLVLSAKLSAPVAGTFSLRYYDGTSIFVQQFNLTTTPTEYSFALTTGAVGDARFYLFRDAADTATQVTCEYAQVEDITGRADQTTPSEYVSVGVESAPYYHGSGVDGVKCFPTDLSGNPIPAATMLGYQAEGARTNHFLQSGTPATQTSGALSTGTYTLWMDGTGSIAVAGATATITGAGTATSSTAVTFVVTVAGTVTYTVTGSPTRAQSENGAQRSSYIATTTIAVTRNADVLTYPSAGNIDGTVGWCYAELGTNWASPGGQKNALGFSASIDGLINHSGSIATGLRIYDNTNSVEKASLPTMQNSRVKYAASWGGSSMAITGAGAAVASGSFDGSIGGTIIAVGCSGAGGSQWDGTIRNVRIGQRQLSASELGAITS